MAFLQKYIGGFFTWWEGLVNWPVSVIGGKTIKWSFVAFAVLVWVCMFVFLPGGLLF
jgi:hypothetical protein